MYYNYIIIYIIFIIVLYMSYKYILFYSYKRPKNLPMYVNIPDYKVDEIKGFLTPDECDLIIKMASPKMSDSYTYRDNKTQLNISTRKSKTCVLWNDTKWIYNRLSEYLPMIKNHSNESLQVSSYEKGGYFRNHYDACVGEEDDCRKMDGYYGPRLLTCLIYLNDDYEGGDTFFPIINKKINPQKGKAIIFQDTDKKGSIIRESLHTGTDVKEGHKWIATIWVRKLKRYFEF
jgi:prolyl 4-hydroxylase